MSNEMVTYERELSANKWEAELEEKIGNNGTNVVITLTDEERQAFKGARHSRFMIKVWSGNWKI